MMYLYALAQLHVFCNRHFRVPFVLLLGSYCRLGKQNASANLNDNPPDQPTGSLCQDLAEFTSQDCNRQIRMRCQQPPEKFRHSPVLTPRPLVATERAPRTVQTT